MIGDTERGEAPTGAPEGAIAQPGQGKLAFHDDGPERTADDEDALVLDLEGWEGPLDLLLTLARHQKVDLARISILDLVDQYLAFVERVRERRLEIAADHLVMASWLAYLKSRLLLPKPVADDEPTGEELAAALAFRLRRLEAMRRSAATLLARPQVGRDTFLRGAPEATAAIVRPAYEASLFLSLIHI